MSDIESKSIESVDKSMEDLNQLTPEKESEFISRLRRIPCCGLFLSFFSGIVYATAGFTVELMDNVDPTLVVVIRSIIQLSVFLPLTLYQGQSVMGDKQERKAMIERCFFGFICFVLAYYSLEYIAFSDAQSIIFASPALTTLLGCILLNESCGIVQVITMIITFIGVLFVCRPAVIFGEKGLEDQFTSDERMIGIILSVFCCLTLSYTYIGMRKLQRTSTAAQNAGYSLFCIFAGSLVLNIFSFSTQTVIRTPFGIRGWVLILINGVCGIIGQASQCLALKIEEAGLVAIMRSFDIVMAFMYQALFLPKQPIHWTSILGSVLICSGCFIVSIKKYFESRRNRNNNNNNK